MPTSSRSEKSSVGSNKSNLGLPKLVGGGNFPGDSFSQSPLVFKDQIERLSGLKNPNNSSGLYAEMTSPLRPSKVCVRCGMHASICMPCADLQTESILTFYRRTRAAGAAVLFFKGFRRSIK
jgi:hypothetical protein